MSRSPCRPAASDLPGVTADDARLRRRRFGVGTTALLGLAAALGLAAPAGAVQVRSVSPSGEVAEVRQVLLRFAAPVVPFGAPRLADPARLRCEGLGPAALTPAGQGRWLGPAEWAWELAEPLPPGVRCTLTLERDWQPMVAVQPASGAAAPPPRLEGPRAFSFSTGAPTVLQVWPWEGSEVEEDAHWLLQLNGPVQAASLEGRVACEVEGLGERLPAVLVTGPVRDAVLKTHRLSAAKAADALLLRCQRPLPPGAAVRLVWEPGIASAKLPQLVGRERLSWRWQVREPFRAEFSCERERAESPCLPLRPMRLHFSAPLPRAQAAGVRLQIDGPPGAASGAAGAGRVITPRQDPDDRSPTVQEVIFDAPLPENTAFRLLLPAGGLRDESGRALDNAATFPLAVRTGALPPLAKFAAAPFGVLEAGTPAEPAALPITLRHLPYAGRAQLAVKRLDATTPDAELMRWHARLAHYHESRLTAREAGLPEARWWIEEERRDGDGAPRRVREERRIASRELSLLARERGVQRQPLPVGAAAAAAASAASAPGRPPREAEVLGLPLPQPGYHLVELESQLLGRALLAAPPGAEPPPMYVRSGVLVTGMGVHFKRGRSSSLVWVTTLDRARPVADAEVAVNDCRGQRLWAGRTDAAGLAHIPRGFADEMEPEGQPRCIGEPAYFVSARKALPGGGSDLAFVYSHWNRGIEPWRFAHPTWGDAEGGLRVHSLLDRSLLRAGETLSMKHLVRAETPQGLALVNGADWPTELQITHTGSGEVTRVALPAPAQPGAPLRALPMQWRVPEQAKLGRYELTLHREAQQWSAGAFRVEAFRVPQLDARLIPPKGPLVAPAGLDFAVQLTHLSGGGMALPASFSALLREREPQFAGWEEYRFAPPRERVPGERLLPEGEGADDGAGARLIVDRHALRTDARGAARIALPKLPALAELKRPAELLAELTFDDPNGERQTVAQTLPLWPAALQVGLRGSTWLAPGGRVPVQAVVLDTAGRVQADREVRVRARLLRSTSIRQRVVGGFYAYQERQEVEELGEVCRGRSDARGLLLCEATLARSGEVELIARVVDDAGRASEAAVTMWLSQGGEQWFAQDDDDRIDLLPEKRELQPGDTARLQLRMPFREATVLLTVEREGVLDARVLTLRGRDPVIELPIPKDGAQADAWAPNVYVSALVLRGRVREVPWYSFFQWGWRAPVQWWRAWRDEGPDHRPPGPMVDLAKPAFKLGVAALQIGLAGQRLDVRVETDQPQYGPRQTARATVTVTRGGQPVSDGEIAFAAVDEGLLALAPNPSWDLPERLYPQRPWGVETATAQNEIVGRRHYGRKALPPGGGGGLNPTRELFDTLLIWRPTLRLDALGRARVDVPLNDSLSAFRLVALAESGAQRFGRGEARIRVTQDLQLIAGLPALVREGDRWDARFTLRNTTARRLHLQASLKAQPTVADSADLLTPARPAGDAGRLTFAPQRLTLEPQGAAEVVWPVDVPAGLRSLSWEAAVVEVNADGGAQANPLRDALRFVQQVEPALPLRVLQSSLQPLEGSLQLPVAPPPRASAGAPPPPGGLRLELRPRLTGALPGIRQWFEAYPYRCLEQRASRAVGLRDLAAWKALLQELPAHLDGDGLPHYFPLRPEDSAGGGSDRLAAYLIALSDTAAWPLPPEQRDRLLEGLTAFVEGRIERRFPTPRADRDVRKLAALEALSRHGRAQARQLASLEITPAQWPTSALLDWLALLQRVDAIPQRDARLAEAQRLLRSRLVAGGSVLRFADESADRWSWLMEGPDANAARLLLHAVHSADAGWKADAPRLATGLALRLHGGDGPQRDPLARGAFSTTTANAWASLAFERFSLQFETQQVDGRSRATLGPAVREHDWARQPEGGRLVLPWPAQTATLQLAQQGSGRPWVALQSLAALPPAGPVSAGYRLERRVVPVEQKQPGRLSRGDVLRVQIVVDAAADFGWVVLSDPLPAGATLLGSGLGRDSRIAAERAPAGEAANPADPADRASTGRAWLAWEERRPEAWRAYYRWLPGGRHEISYTLRLNTSGRFALPPTRVEAMYAPEQHAELPQAALEVLP